MSFLLIPALDNLLGGGGYNGTIQGTFAASTRTPDAGADVTFTVTLTSTAVGTYSFQLTRDGSNVSGATTNPVTIENWQEANDGAYRMLVTDSGNDEVRTFGPINVAIPAETILPLTWDGDGFTFDNNSLKFDATEVLV